MPFNDTACGVRGSFAAIETVAARAAGIRRKRRAAARVTSERVVTRCSAAEGNGTEIRGRVALVHNGERLRRRCFVQILLAERQAARRKHHTRYGWIADHDENVLCGRQC